MAETDLISRQAAIEINQSYHGQMPNEVNHRIWKEINELPSAQPEPQWIPCSERLPEDVEIGEEYPTVIFCTKDNVYVGFYEYYLGGRWWAAEDYTVDKVIAWMPLPEPYQENKDERD